MEPEPLDDEQRPILVFVGSPGDMTTYRQAVRHVTEALNDDDFFDGPKLEYRDWGDGSPGSGRPQEVVFKEMGEPDVFVGVIGAKIGSTTGKEAGGTVEEYKAAYHRYRATGIRPEILMYFQHVGALKTRAEYDALGEVITFREGIHERLEVLPWDVTDAEEFRSVIRRHLIQAVRRLLQKDEERQARGDNYLDEPIEIDVESGEETLPTRVGSRTVNLIQLRLKLEAKLTWLANRLFGRFVTIGSLEYDGYLPGDHAKRLARLLAHDPSKVDDADQAELRSFARAVADDVQNFRATTFDGYVRRTAEKAGWTVRDFEQSDKHRPDFLLTRDDGSPPVRVAARLILARKSNLLNNTQKRLRGTRDDEPAALLRVIVIPDVSPHAATGARDDPQVVRLGELREALLARQ